MASCPGCAAENRPGSSFCWQCYRPLAAAAAATAGAHAQASPSPAPSAERGKWHISIPGPGSILRHTWIGFLVLSIIGGVWKYLEDRQVELPDSMAGVERVENPEFEAYAQEVEEALGISVEAATYANASRVFGVMAGSELDGARPAERLWELPSIEEGVAFKKAQIRSFQSPTAFFACVPFVGIVNGTLCLWNGSGTSGVVYAYAMDMRAARDLSEEIQAAVGR